MRKAMGFGSAIPFLVWLIVFVTVFVTVTLLLITLSSGNQVRVVLLPGRGSKVDLPRSAKT